VLVSGDGNQEVALVTSTVAAYIASSGGPAAEHPDVSTDDINRIAGDVTIAANSTAEPRAIGVGVAVSVGASIPVTLPRAEASPTVEAYLGTNTILNVVGNGNTDPDAATGRLEIVAISAETEEFTRTIREEAGARFPFLTDFGNGYALSLGLAVVVDPAMSSLIASAGWDVPAYQGDTGWILPIPSVFVVGQEGRIVARHVDPDYRRRFDLDRLEETVATLRLPAEPSPSSGWAGNEEFAARLGAGEDQDLVRRRRPAGPDLPPVDGPSPVGLSRAGLQG